MEEDDDDDDDDFKTVIINMYLTCNLGPSCVPIKSGRKSKKPTSKIFPSQTRGYRNRTQPVIWR